MYCFDNTQMDSRTAKGIAEGIINCDDTDKQVAAWQFLHDTGLAYSTKCLAREASLLIESGVIAA